jgi:hypothetical protein
VTLRISRVFTAALLVAVIAAPAFAETRSVSPNAASIVLAQASADTDKRSRKRGETRAKKEPTAGQMAARERQKKCAGEWKTAKAGGKMESGMKWPKFWSACNARLKGNSA